MNRKFNWLATTAGSILAMLLLITCAQTATANSPTTDSNTASTLDRSQPNQLIALSRKKKKLLKSKAKKMATTTPATSTPVTATPTTTTTELTQTTPPPAPPAPTPPAASPPAEPAKAAAPAPNQFSLNTKLQGSIIFGATGTFAGDFDRNPAFGNRTRLELKTDLGGGLLTTRLQAVGLGLNTKSPTAGTTATATNEGSLSWTDGTTDSKIGIDALKYEYPLTSQTQLVVAANAGAADDFTDTINPYFDGDGASGAISTFGNRPSIYYTVQGVGVGVRHKLSDATELSVGYLARNGNTPAAGSGFFGGGYGALAQVSFKTGENSKVGLTYVRSFNSDPGTGSLNANLGGLSNNFGVQGSFQLSPQFALGGWAGYTQNQAAGGDRQIWNWAVTAAAPDFGGKGNLAGFLVGQEPRVTSSGNSTTDSKVGLHIEGFYQVKINDSLSITPGIIYLTAPNQDANSNSAVIGALRSTFTF